MILALPVPYFEVREAARGFGDITAVAQAIQTQEGFFPGSKSYTNNNPGNLAASPWAQSQPGYVGVDSSGFAIFDSMSDGTAALDQLIVNYANKGDTIQSMMEAWAPASVAGNNPTLYAQNVASAAGVSPDTPLSQLLSGSSDFTALDLSSLGLPAFSLPDLSQSTIFPEIPDWVIWLGIAGVALAITRS